jgi:thiol-disulfide isomerase/thioredoxin
MAEFTEDMRMWRKDMSGVIYGLIRFRWIGDIVLLFLAIILLVPAKISYGYCFISPIYSIGFTNISVSFEESIAPEFPEDLQWFNTDKALKLWELRDKKVVLLNFWRYSCIECQHVLRDLARLEKNYADEMVIISVHSGKFTSEKDSENIYQAILRHGIKHPVVNDIKTHIWRIYNVNTWPTLFLIDPTGRIVAQHSGEGVFKAFNRTIDSIIKESEKNGLINRSPLSFVVNTEDVNGSMLSFPAGILADEQSTKLFISDTGHNRIIIADLTGRIIDVCGSGERGYVDGSFKMARFNQPRGLAISDKKLFVADTGNHCIRSVDLTKKTVSTLAGVGRQGHSLSIRRTAGLAALNSPWDLQVVDNNLYIAMAGSHQIYLVNLKSNEISLFAGTGIEDCVDGSRQKAALAQPSGLSTDGRKLYFADSESSSIRRIDLFGEDMVATIVGSGLYQFGDRDGGKPDALLQHPIGLTYNYGLLFVADTYNNKIKIVDPLTSMSKTFLGNGKSGSANSPVPLFDEPADISCALGKLFIADTNNHIIRLADIRTAKVVTLQLRGLETEKEKL